MLKVLLISLLLVGCMSSGVWNTSYPPSPSTSQESTGIAQDSRNTLQDLYATNGTAASLAARAKGILVFPNIVKLGFMVGAQYGSDGVLFENNRDVGHYNIVAGSYGLQAGIQSFSYVMMFMDDESLNYFHQSEGLEIGVGPSVVVVDQGVARSLTTTTARKGVYAFIFDQRGLMAGLGLQGSKISRVP